MQLETYFPDGDKSTHGENGPINVSTGTYQDYTLRDDFISAAKNLGYPYIKDLQDLDSNNGVSTAYRYVSAATGRRQDAAHMYLHPRLRSGQHKNLHVLVKSQVARVLFENSRASGVEFRTGDSTRVVTARKLVILSAGSLGTPQILERSGVGNPDILSAANVPVIAKVPGVGHDYQDHQMLVVTYKSTLTVDQSVDSIVNGNMNPVQFVENNASILSWNGIETFAKLRPTQHEVEGFAPGLRKLWARDYAQTPNKPLAVIVLMAGCVDLVVKLKIRTNIDISTVFLVIHLHTLQATSICLWRAIARTHTPEVTS